MHTVLIADDHPIVRSGVEGLLRNSCYDVVGAVSDGAAVLEQLAASQPDILLLDVQMRNRSGIDILRVLRSRGDNRPIVLLTASLTVAASIEALKLGVNGIVLKDSAPELLIRCLDTVARGGRWIDRSVLEMAVATSIEPGSGTLDKLTVKERAIAGLVAQGRRNREIGTELGMAEATVKVHLYRMYEKLGVANRTELALIITKGQR
jgi:two-component system nitrate/nitrite response regulator NarP